MNHSLENGNQSFLISIILGILTWFTPDTVELGVKIVVGIGSIVTAIMACRYYYYSIKEKKQLIEEHKNKKHDEEHY